MDHQLAAAFEAIDQWGADHAAVAGAVCTCLSKALPRYKQPRRFEVVADLPRTATGKIQHRKLRDQRVPK